MWASEETDLDWTIKGNVHIYPHAHPDQMRHKASLSSHQADSSRQVKRDSIEPINKIYGLLVLDRSVQLAEPAVNCSGS